MVMKRNGPGACAAGRARKGALAAAFAGLAGVALTAAPAGTAVRAQSDVSGVWQITLKTQTGEHGWTATFEQDGGAVSGEIDMNDGEGALLLEGTVEGSTIKWGFIVPDLDGDMPINLSGEVQGATIKGDEGSFVWYGTGVWTGTKQ